MVNSKTNSGLAVGDLVVDKASPTLQSVRMVVGFREGKCVTAYVMPPPWMKATRRFFVADPERLLPAPEELVVGLDSEVETPVAEDECGEEISLGTELRRLLVGLEGALEQPLEPGVEVDYCLRVMLLLPEIERAWKAHEELNQDVRREIMKEDLALVSQAEQLGERATHLTRELLELWKMVLNIGSGAPSDAALRSAEELRRRLLRWSEGVRALEQELMTCLIDAHYRDRGGRG